MHVIKLEAKTKDAVPVKIVTLKLTDAQSVQLLLFPLILMLLKLLLRLSNLQLVTC